MQTNLMQCAAYDLNTDRLTPTPSSSAAILAILIRLFSKYNLWIWCCARALNFFGRPWRGLFWVDPVLLFILFIYAFSRRFYPKRLTVHSGHTFFVSICVPWESKPQPFALLTQCSTTEPYRNTAVNCCMVLANVLQLSFRVLVIFL